ncbi:MAG: DUF2059 domain-containing protein, partial [Phyllobacterium sp.]
MNRATGFRRLIAPLSIALLLGGVYGAQAQEITPSHLAAARAAVTAIKTTDQFDTILPDVAQQLKSELI